MALKVEIFWFSDGITFERWLGGIPSTSQTGFPCRCDLTTIRAGKSKYLDKKMIYLQIGVISIRKA